MNLKLKRNILLIFWFNSLSNYSLECILGGINKKFCDLLTSVLYIWYKVHLHILFIYLESVSKKRL